jgi:hypothetical protein
MGGELNNKGAALIFARALGPDSPTLELDQLPDNRQAQARRDLVAGRSRRETLEPAK